MVRISFHSPIGRLTYRLFAAWYVIKKEGLWQVSGKALRKLICAMHLDKSSPILRKMAMPKTGRYTIKVLLPHSPVIKMGKDELQELLSSRKQRVLDALRKRKTHRL